MLKRYEEDYETWTGDFLGMQPEEKGEWLRVDDVLELLRLIHQTDQTPPYIMDQPVAAGYRPLDGSRFETPREITRKVIAQLTD